MSASTTMSDRERLIELLRELWQAGDNADDRHFIFGFRVAQGQSSE